MIEWAPPSVHAVVLAAGEGTRMPPLVSPSHPKALLPIANRPMLFYPLFSLFRAGILSVTVVSEARFEPLISAYVQKGFPDDAAVTALAKSHNALKISVLVREEEAGTADVLRKVETSAHDLIVLSVDSVCDVSLQDVLYFHREARASCTSVLVPMPLSGTSAKPSFKVSSKTASKAPPSQPEVYALLTGSDRLLALLHPGDIPRGCMSVPKQLVRRYAHMTLRSDVADAHVYVWHVKALRAVLAWCPAVYSVKYDAVPYAARRQHALSRVAHREAWTLPGDYFSVNAFVAPRNVYAMRANTVAGFRTANLDVANGCVAAWLTGTALTPAAPGGASAKKKDKKGGKKGGASCAFETSGEQVFVTADCAIGEKSSAGDRTSVKRSVVGARCKLGKNVKLNGCVVMDGVCIEDGCNLSYCVVCEDAKIGGGCVLKECRVPRAVEVETKTEAEDRDFGLEATGMLDIFGG